MLGAANVAVIVPDCPGLTVKLVELNATVAESLVNANGGRRAPD